MIFPRSYHESMNVYNPVQLYTEGKMHDFHMQCDFLMFSKYHTSLFQDLKVCYFVRFHANVMVALVKEVSVS
jgi:hypothetical protein